MNESILVLLFRYVCIWGWSVTAQKARLCGLQTAIDFAGLSVTCSNTSSTKNLNPFIQNLLWETVNFAGKAWAQFSFNIFMFKLLYSNIHAWGQTFLRISFIWIICIDGSLSPLFDKLGRSMQRRIHLFSLIKISGSKLSTHFWQDPSFLGPPKRCHAFPGFLQFSERNHKQKHILLSVLSKTD